MNKDFEKALATMHEKYGEDFEILNGIHESQLNFSDFIDGFIDKPVADITIDANANAFNKDIRSLLSEKGKSHDKLFAMNKIFYEIKKKYNLHIAKEWLEAEYSGGFYLHDAWSTTYIPYCYAYDVSRLATEGLFFLKNYNNQPPKHLTTFVDDIIEYISYMSNRSSGAVGIPNVLIWTYYFWKKDCAANYYIKNPDYYIRQMFQKLIYRLNQPFMRIDQSAFVNFSIFDKHYVEALFGGVKYPDGTYVIDEIENIIEHQKTFMEVVSAIRSENMFTFPVLTYSLLYKNGRFQDEDFARWCSDHNATWNDSNFFISGDVTSLSNCPLSGDTEIFYYSDRYNRYFTDKIKEVYYNTNCDTNHKIKTLSNGKEVECKINKFNIPIEYKITLVNGAIIKTTANHLNKVYGKDYVQSKDLTTDDYLPYGINQFIASDNLSYEEGLLIGMFLGNGSYRNQTEIVFSINRSKKQKLIEFIYDYCPQKFGAIVTEDDCISPISNEESCTNIIVNSAYLRGLIQQFVKGKDSLTKEISSKAYMQSISFRKGIIDGLYKTNGDNSNRIYTSSILIKNSLISLFSTLGMVANITEDNRKERLGNNTCYTIRYYEPNIRTQLKNVYIIDDDYFWVRIKSIEKLEHHSLATSYCLEVIDDSEPIFTLGNGIITHNCRLLSNTAKLDAFINSIGGTALSVGSIKVNTMNLMRIAIETEYDEKKYLNLLKKRAMLCCKTLDVIRHIITRNIEKGLLPTYQEGAMEIDKQYCTIGILGLYEVIEAFNYIKTDEFGYVYYTEQGMAFAEKIFDVLNEVKDSFTSEYSFNIESVPAERAAIILCQKDNLIYDLKEKFIYSNQWIPLSTKCTVQEKLRVSSVLDVKCSGGLCAY